MTSYGKPSAMALNEVTTTIICEKFNYHETFMMDTTTNSSFTFNGKDYNIPAQETGHYQPSFWNFQRKLAMFYEQHRTLATLFDWFGLRKKASYEIGYLYKEGNPEPIDLDSYVLDSDWALDNYFISKNQTVEGHYRNVDSKLRGPKSPLGSLMMVVLIIGGIIAAIVVISMLMGNNAPTQAVQNVTATQTPLTYQTPLASPFLRGP